MLYCKITDDCANCTLCTYICELFKINENGLVYFSKNYIPKKYKDKFDYALINCPQQAIKVYTKGKKIE